MIYGLANDEDKTDIGTVDNLLESILGLDIEPRRVERTKMRSPDKPGVLKVEMYSLEDKVEILRAKRKVEEHEKYSNVTIKNCESHAERVSRFNSKLLLSKFADGDKYTITGHGLIKAKSDLSKRDGNKGGNANGDDEEVVKEDPTSMSVTVGDNGEPREEEEPQQSGGTRPTAENTERKRATDLKASSGKPGNAKSADGGSGKNGTPAPTNPRGGRPQRASTQKNNK